MNTIRYTAALTAADLKDLTAGQLALLKDQAQTAIKNLKAGLYPSLNADEIKAHTNCLTRITYWLKKKADEAEAAGVPVLHPDDDEAGDHAAEDEGQYDQPDGKIQTEELDPEGTDPFYYNRLEAAADLAGLTDQTEEVEEQPEAAQIAAEAADLPVTDLSAEQLPQTSFDIWNSNAEPAIKLQQLHSRADYLRRIISEQTDSQPAQAELKDYKRYARQVRRTIRKARKQQQ